MGLFAMLDACQRELLSDYFAASMCDPASPSAGFRSADRLTIIATHVNATPVTFAFQCLPRNKPRPDQHNICVQADG